MTAKEAIQKADATASVLDEAYERGAAETRASIVAFLRADQHRIFYTGIAGRIERGDDKAGSVSDTEPETA